MPKAYHNYSFFIIHHSLFIKIKNATSRTGAPFGTVPPCFAEVTASCLLCIGSTRPDLSGRTKVARSVSHRGLPLSPLRSWCLRLLLFRIALQYLEYFSMNFGIVNNFFEIFPHSVGRGHASALQDQNDHPKPGWSFLFRYSPAASPSFPVCLPRSWETPSSPPSRKAHSTASRARIRR